MGFLLLWLKFSGIHRIPNYSEFRYYYVHESWTMTNHGQGSVSARHWPNARPVRRAGFRSRPHFPRHLLKIFFWIFIKFLISFLRCAMSFAAKNSSPSEFCSFKLIFEKLDFKERWESLRDRSVMNFGTGSGVDKDTLGTSFFAALSVQNLFLMLPIKFRPWLRMVLSVTT